MPSRFPYDEIVDELRASILDGRLATGIGESACRAFQDEPSNGAADDGAAEGRGAADDRAGPRCLRSSEAAGSVVAFRRELPEASKRGVVWLQRPDGGAGAGC